MALSPQLLQFKSSGVYRLEFDKSQTANINVETLRLVVGHSRKGPYNTPVLITNTEHFVNVFGSIDRALEKKGMFFHRSALESLSRGPILALNVSSFNASDLGSYACPVTDGSDSVTATALGVPVATSGIGTGIGAYTSFFDMDKFMTPSDTKVLETLGNNPNNLINLVNIKQSGITAFIRKAQNVSEFNITAREWYGVGSVPSYLNDFDYMSDFMVDIFVFKGEFDPTAMQHDPIYSEFFTAEGLTKTKLAQFSNLRQVTLEAQYTGSVIPGFKDLEGRNLYIETMINNESRKTGLFCAINEDAITDETGTKIDLVGHVAPATNNAVVSHELLSYVITAGASNLRVIDEDFDGVDPATFPTLPSGPANVSGVYTATGSMFTVDYATAPNTPTTFPISAGDYVRAKESGRLALVKRVAKTSTTKYEVYCDVELDSTPTASWGHSYIKSYENATEVYKPFVLAGSVQSVKTIKEALSALSAGTGLYDALVDKDIIDYRYIVDTFTSFSTPDLLNKVELAQLAHDRQNVSAILNAPTVADFKASFEPSFLDADGNFQVEYVATGGNLDKNPTALYNLPTIGEGANYAFYYGPGLVVSDNGKDIIVPPAAYVSNNYIDKYTTAQPWSIIAGPRRGVVTGTNVKGTEFSFDKNDRDVLEPFGINPIVFQRGVGLTILGNKTGQQSIKSALSSAHVREALIHIQEGIANILKNYVFEFNNTQTRLEIKTLVDSFMESIKADGGVYAFKNIMDQTNNTDEVLDNNYGIVDTYVEPVKGLEIVVHRTTILNTGEIATGNFN